MFFKFNQEDYPIITFGNFIVLESRVFLSDRITLWVVSPDEESLTLTVVGRRWTHKDPCSSRSRWTKTIDRDDDTQNDDDDDDSKILTQVQ